MRLYQNLFLYFFGMIFILFATITFVQYQRERSSRADELDKLLDTYNLIIHNYIEEKNYTWQNLDQIVRLFPDKSPDFDTGSPKFKQFCQQSLFIG